MRDATDMQPSEISKSLNLANEIEESADFGERLGSTFFVNPDRHVSVRVNEGDLIEALHTSCTS